MTGVSLLIALKHSDVTQARIFLPSAPLRDILLLLQRVRVNTKALYCRSLIGRWLASSIAPATAVRTGALCWCRACFSIALGIRSGSLCLIVMGLKRRISPLIAVGNHGAVLVLEVALMMLLCLFGMRGVLVILQGRTVLLLATTLVAVVTASTLMLGVLMLLTLSLLLWLEAALLLGPFVQGRGKVLQRGDEMNAKISLGFMCLLDRLGDSFDGTREAFQGGMDCLQADGDAFEKFGIKICFGV